MTTILLLNASMEPLNTVPYQRAVNMLISGKAHAVEGVAKVLKTVSKSFVVPQVIALNYYVSAPHRKVSVSKQGVLKRDNWTCVFCGIHPGMSFKGETYKRNHFSVDHVIPKSRSGKNTWGNLVCACKPCNEKKSNRTPHEAGMKMRFEPKTPRRQTFVFGGTTPESWTKYLQF